MRGRYLDFRSGFRHGFNLNRSGTQVFQSRTANKLPVSFTVETERFTRMIYMQITTLAKLRLKLQFLGSVAFFSATILKAPVF